ncbi:MAG: hypothetical protein HY399_00890 [Elusimicrobia bacterium]|nr:hypothetical protein [Elusimicrobiota bacterium]
MKKTSLSLGMIIFCGGQIKAATVQEDLEQAAQPIYSGTAESIYSQAALRFGEAAPAVPVVDARVSQDQPTLTLEKSGVSKESLTVKKHTEWNPKAKSEAIDGVWYIGLGALAIKFSTFGQVFGALGVASGIMGYVTNGISGWDALWAIGMGTLLLATPAIGGAVMVGLGIGVLLHAIFVH